MEKELLKSIPKRFLCPYCGEWHKWNGGKLEHYKYINVRARLKCPNVPFEYNESDYRFYFCDNYFHYTVERMCYMANQYMDGEILISSICEKLFEPIVTFDVEFTSKNDVGREYCIECDYKTKCNCARLGDNGDNRHMVITFGFEFEQSDYEKYTKPGKLMRLIRELEESDNAKKVKEQSLQKRKSVKVNPVKCKF